MFPRLPLEQVFGGGCVGRSKDLELADRNQRIVEMVGEGYSFQVVGDNFGITRQRVSQIVQEYQETLSDDAYRDLQRTQLEFLSEEMFKIFRGPGKLVVTPGGKIVCEYYADGRTDNRGQALPDPSRPVYDPFAKVDVANTIIRIQERQSRAYGLDRVKQRERDQSGEIAEFMNYMSQLDAENKALRARIAELDHHDVQAVVESDDSP